MNADYGLRQLQRGDRLRYHGAEWRVMTVSRYDETNYHTEEWCLKAVSGGEYYLLREWQEDESAGTWYLAEEMPKMRLIDPRTKQDISLDLWQMMHDRATPPPELQAAQRTYRFESSTEGRYRSGDGLTKPRVTWDYWDEPHLWNLALESWEDRTFVVYQSRTVQFADFELVPRTAADERWVANQERRSSHSSFMRETDAGAPKNDQMGQYIGALIMIVVGFMLMVSGV